jgi:hypothetical protein
MAPNEKGPEISTPSPRSRTRRRGSTHEASHETPRFVQLLAAVFGGAWSRFGSSNAAISSARGSFTSARGVTVETGTAATTAVSGRGDASAQRPPDATGRAGGGDAPRPAVSIASDKTGREK